MEVLVQNSSEDVEPSSVHHLEAAKDLEEEELLSEVIDLDEEKPSRSWTDLVEEEELEQSLASQLNMSQPQIVVSLKLLFWRPLTCLAFTLVHLSYLLPC